MENFRISQMQDKLTTSFYVKSPCLVRVPPCGLTYFYFQTQWMNDQCWSNLWLLNKSVHGLSSTGTKASEIQGCFTWIGCTFFLCSLLTVMPCETESKAATHDFSQEAPQFPDAYLAHFFKKWWTKPANEGAPSVSWSKGEHIHNWFTLISVSLNQAVIRIPVRSIFFPPSGCLVTSFMWKFDSLAIYGANCCISVDFFKAHAELLRIPLKNATSFP